MENSIQLQSPDDDSQIVTQVHRTKTMAGGVVAVGNEFAVNVNITRTATDTVEETSDASISQIETPVDVPVQIEVERESDIERFFGAIGRLNSGDRVLIIAAFTITAICLVFALILFFITPGLPDEFIALFLAIASGAYGVKKLSSDEGEN